MGTNHKLLLKYCQIVVDGIATNSE